MKNYTSKASFFFFFNSFCELLEDSLLCWISPFTIFSMDEVYFEYRVKWIYQVDYPFLPDVVSNQFCYTLISDIMWKSHRHMFIVRDRSFRLETVTWKKLGSLGIYFPLGISNNYCRSVILFFFVISWFIYLIITCYGFRIIGLCTNTMLFQ